MKNLSLICLMALVSSSCAGLFQQRSFIDQMERSDARFFTPGEDFPVIPGDRGRVHRSAEELISRTPASGYQKDVMDYQRSISSELEDKEHSLTEQERADYEAVKEYFSGPSEKIYYLSLSPQERPGYLAMKGIGGRQQAKRFYSASNLGAITTLATQRESYESEIYLGMEKNEVMDRWGRPDHIEIAGDPRRQNERWVFERRGRQTFVYFESGRVHGWTKGY